VPCLFVFSLHYQYRLEQGSLVGRIRHHRAGINKSGSFRYQATKVGADTALALKKVFSASDPNHPQVITDDESTQKTDPHTP
jgi:hypothetical protein